jgi:hypothetical protein
MVEQIRNLQGLAFERMYEAEVAYFADAQNGIAHGDIEAALILKDMLQRLYAGEIHAEYVDEDSTFEDLVFVSTQSIEAM